MGPAAAAPNTLPDPNERTNDPAPAAAMSADDLLAQLAGEEIDRLLAETETDPAPSTSTGESSIAPDAQAPADSQVDPLDSSIQTVDKMGDQLDALLKEIETPKPAPADVPADMVTIGQLRATSQSEVNALLGDNLTESAVDQSEDERSPLPIYVRALEMLNLPFNALPDALRESLGKMAILTLFNSIAVLLYVLIFRRH